ncbi:hypothetical protein V1477_000082 [Vespula maculifrons]|uniref:Uncharacterized protein n=1 Tax=Vespula maculifrons TaxID=7453 RepID=A0ABD2B0D4_VESMC
MRKYESSLGYTSRADLHGRYHCLFLGVRAADPLVAMTKSDGTRFRMLTQEGRLMCFNEDTTTYRHSEPLL